MIMSPLILLILSDWTFSSFRLILFIGLLKKPAFLIFWYFVVLRHAHLELAWWDFLYSSYVFIKVTFLLSTEVFTILRLSHTVWGVDFLFMTDILTYRFYVLLSLHNLLLFAIDNLFLSTSFMPCIMSLPSIFN